MFLSFTSLTHFVDSQDLSRRVCLVFPISNHCSDVSFYTYINITVWFPFFHTSKTVWYINWYINRSTILHPLRLHLPHFSKCEPTEDQMASSDLSSTTYVSVSLNLLFLGTPSYLLFKSNPVHRKLDGLLLYFLQKRRDGNGCSGRGISGEEHGRVRGLGWVRYRFQIG